MESNLDSLNRLDSDSETESSEVVVHPTLAPEPQETTNISPATVSALVTLLDSLTSRKATIKEFTKSMYSNAVWVIMIVLILVLVEMVPAAGEVLDRLVHSFIDTVAIYKQPSQ